MLPTSSLLRVAGLLLGFLVLAGLLTSGAGPAAAVPSVQDAEPAPLKYLGQAKCKNCHRAEEAGDQHGVWSDTAHAKAFEVLGTPAGLAAGKSVGVDEPQKSERCLKCHTTAHGVEKDRLARRFNAEDGVQCESCHGAGSLHLSNQMALATKRSKEERAKNPEFLPLDSDEIIVRPTKDTCYGCHNAECPTFERFCYYEAIQEVRHLDPRKPRTPAELAALLVCGCEEACDEGDCCVERCPDEGCGVPPEKARDE